MRSTRTRASTSSPSAPRRACTPSRGSAPPAAACTCSSRSPSTSRSTRPTPSSRPPRRRASSSAVCYQDRFAPDLCALKDVIDRGGLGRLLLVDARMPWYRPPSYYASSSWRGTWELDGGGALMNQGIAHRGPAPVAARRRRAMVQGMTATRAPRHRGRRHGTRPARVCQSGARGTLSATTAAYPGYPRRLMIAGTAGTVTIERDALIAADIEGGPVPGLVVHPPADGRRALVDAGRVRRVGPPRVVRRHRARDPHRRAPALRRSRRAEERRAGPRHLRIVRIRPPVNRRSDRPNRVQGA